VGRIDRLNSVDFSGYPLRILARLDEFEDYSAIDRMISAVNPALAPERQGLKVPQVRVLRSYPPGIGHHASGDQMHEALMMRHGRGSEEQE
jgi:hypothetical protein